MRKLFIVLISALLVGVSTQARAEISTTTFTGDRFEEQQVIVMCYNNSGSDIESNAVVILDVSATEGSTLGTYITTTATADDSYVFGVTDEVIEAGEVGRICVRGPHLVYDLDSTHAVRAILATSTTVGRTTTYATSDGTTGGQLGQVIDASVAEGVDYCTVWVNPQVHD